ncbi:MAG: DUF4330 family protein [Vicinamibacterales bacterium]
MAMVDTQGRLFGRLNLLDAIVVVAILGLLPIGYGSYLLFRTPAPRITAVEPTTLTAAPIVRLALRGENFRPYMRISLGSYQAFSFLFAGTDEAEVELRNVPSGVYDVVLYDYERERARLPKAVTVAPSPIPAASAVAVGAIGNVAADQVPQFKPGLVLGSIGEIVAVGKPRSQATRVFAGSRMVEIQDPKALRLPVAIRVGCYIREREGRPECSIGEAAAQPGVLIMVATPVGALPFQIDQVRGSQPLESVRVVVRFSGAPELVSQVRKGDIDSATAANELAAGARVVDVATRAPAVRDATLELQAQRDLASGWVHVVEPLRIGGALVLRTPLYELTGTITALAPDPRQPAVAPSPR